MEALVAVHSEGTMKAIVQEGSGSADVRRLREVDRPVVTDDRVLADPMSKLACTSSGASALGSRWRSGAADRARFATRTQKLRCDFAAFLAPLSGGSGEELWPM